MLALKPLTQTAVSDAFALLQVLSDPKGAKATLESLVAEYNRSDAMLKQALSATESAKKTRMEADEMLAKADIARKASSQVEYNLSMRENSVKTREADVYSKEASLQSLKASIDKSILDNEKDMKERETGAKAKYAAAERLMDEAMQLKSKYEDKLSKLKSLV